MESLVEIRTWPSCTGVYVIDVLAANTIEYFGPSNIAKALYNPEANFYEKEKQAIETLQSDQFFLQVVFDSEETVELISDRSFYELTLKVLAKHGFDEKDVNIRNIKNFIKQLERMELNKLFEFLIDWYDVIEQHCDFGYSEINPLPWIERSQPDNCYQFEYLSGGDNPYKLFKELIQTDLEKLNLGTVIRWVYYHKAEFSDVTKRFALLNKTATQAKK